MLRRNGCNIVLGTDSLASNWSLRITDEIKTIRQHFPAIPLEEIFGWATLNGAKALGMDAVLGSFEKGKKPGVVLIDENNGSSVQVII
jgi:cytosine/adenosine deaminase-related metal-dependent hydrolase